jgi:hypothetical protein
MESNCRAVDWPPQIRGSPTQWGTMCFQDVSLRPGVSAENGETSQRNQRWIHGMLFIGKGYGRKRLWPNMKYYIATILEGLRKITKNLSWIASLRTETWTRNFLNTKHSVMMSAKWWSLFHVRILANCVSVLQKIFMLFTNHPILFVHV